MAEEPANHPEVFISYSWSSESHKAWVEQLANDLTDSGVHVHLDVWDVDFGQDFMAFMERMETDPAIRKVILVCDREYVRKADANEAGVGAEAQLIPKFNEARMH